MVVRSLPLAFLYTNAAAKEDKEEMTAKLMLTLSVKYDEEANNLMMNARSVLNATLSSS